ncbi:MAG TPA: hypothetical protein VFQ63_00570 [Patescibacteria group bacterium]|nr:hypothetical protein [Patescibacteria group bacterium]
MKKLASLLLPAAAFISFATPAFADINACPQNGQFDALCNLTAGNLQNVIGPAITFVFVLATLVALGYLIWGGLKWIMSQGDKNGVETARNHIIAAIIGLVLIFLSYLVINIVLSFFAPGASLNHLVLPHL